MNAPFSSPLSPSDQIVVRIAEWMNKGYSTAEAFEKARAGVAWAEMQFRANFNRVLNNPQVSATARRAVAKALQKGPQYAGNAMLRFLASLAGFITTPVVAGVLIGTAVLATGGAIYVATADKPIQPGPRIAQRGTPPPVRGRDEVTYNQDQYFVFVLPEVSNGSVVISQESDLKTAPGCSFAGGGLCSNDGNDPLVKYRAVSPGFNTYDEAKAKWCADLAGAKITNHPVAGDSTAAVYGGDYWIGTAPACG